MIGHSKGQWPARATTTDFQRITTSIFQLLSHWKKYYFRWISLVHISKVISCYRMIFITFVQTILLKQIFCLFLCIQSVSQSVISFSYSYIRSLSSKMLHKIQRPFCIIQETPRGGGLDLFPKNIIIYRIYAILVI